MRPDKVLSLIGLAAKGGRVVSGEFMTEKAIASGQAFLVIIAEDASANARKKISDSCNFYKVPFYVYGMSEDLGHCMGKEFRKTAAITDEGLAKALQARLEELEHS